MDIYSACQWLALRNVYNYTNGRPSDTEYTLGRIFRWYSKTFHTPLHEVDDLPLYDVILAYWHEKYEGFEPDALDEEVQEMVKPVEVRNEERLEADRTDAEMWELAQEELAAQAAEDTKKRAQSNLGKRPTNPLPQLGGREAEMIPRSSVAAPPPAIKMDFEHVDTDLDLDQDSFGFLEPPKGK
jgi:hypothetical protein